MKLTLFLGLFNAGLAVLNGYFYAVTGHPLNLFVTILNGTVALVLLVAVAVKA